MILKSTKKEKNLKIFKIKVHKNIQKKINEKVTADD